jgi:hypothetical protein
VLVHLAVAPRPSGLGRSVEGAVVSRRLNPLLTFVVRWWIVIGQGLREVSLAERNVLKGVELL